MYEVHIHNEKEESDTIYERLALILFQLGYAPYKADGGGVAFTVPKEEVTKVYFEKVKDKGD